MKTDSSTSPEVSKLFFNQQNIASEFMLEKFFYFVSKKIDAQNPRSIVAFCRIVLGAYKKQNRHYHNLYHIADMLEVFWKNFKLFNNPYYAALSIYVHDIFLDVNRKDNELRSAQAGLEFLFTTEVSFEKAVFVYENILATKHDNLAKSNDAKLVADLDLMSLGYSPDQFKKNTELIRIEYSMFSDDQFIDGRKAFFDNFLSSRSFVYQTNYFRNRFEKQARENIYNFLKS